MVIKLLGGMLVIGSATVIGYIMASKYAKRPEELRTLQAALQMLESEIAFSMSTLPQAFDRISHSFEHAVGKLFSYTSSLIKERTGITAKEAWIKALNACTPILHLEKQDREILMAFGNALGRLDKDSQIKNIHLACTKLSLEEKKAEELKYKYVRMYKSLGVLGGILIVLLLL